MHLAAELFGARSVVESRSGRHVLLFWNGYVSKVSMPVVVSTPSGSTSAVS
jgi:hypothetical protein